jgi:hypothetical protein
MILGDLDTFLERHGDRAEESSELVEERRIWRFIRQPPAGSPRMWLGFGNADRFALAHRLMARSLPAAQVKETAGGHDWPVWLQLWKLFLADMPAAAASS